MNFSLIAFIFTALLSRMIALAAPTDTVTIQVAPSPAPTSTALASNEMAGCPMYASDPFITRDITTMAVASTNTSDHTSGTQSYNSYGHLGTLNDGPYKLQIQTNKSSYPTTTIGTQSGGHSSWTPNVAYPIASYTNQNALTNGSGDQAMEIIAQSGYGTASGCEVIDGYKLTYVGTNGVSASSGMWTAYSACQSDPGGLMINETCNSNADKSGLEIAAGMHAEQFVSPQVVGWSPPNHALLFEDACSAGNGPLCENSTKMRLRVCGVDDAVTNDNNPGVNCVNMPNPTTAPQAYLVAYDLLHFGGINSDNGCCFNIARNYTPQAGDTDMDYSQLNAFISTISGPDLDEMVSNN